MIPNKILCGLVIFSLCVLVNCEDCCRKTYEISDDLGLGKKFDGIGGISGGGATSKLLVSYPEPQRSQILDYLFKPNFGASLQILKVEIGGGDASVGAEASHMPEEWDENYNRGYEWWLMKEAKKRNPDIKLFGLSWSWPGWLGADIKSPYKNLSKTAMYTIKWIQGAKKYHNLTIDYIGIWNEQWCNPDYIMFLRKALNQANLSSVSIIGCDDWLEDYYPLLWNTSVVDSLYAFGVHYPGTIIPKEVLATNLTIWSSEDYSTFNDDVGAGCWARILNQNYVIGHMTSTISWNLIASYYPGLPFEYEGLMTAVQPWSGFYEVKNPIWMTAHTTQFTEIGYNYLLHKRGVGLLNHGGSYVSFVSPNRKNLTIVIETMTHDHSICIRPELPPYEVKNQKIILKFGGNFTTLKELHLWRTSFDFKNPNKSVIFHYDGKVEIIHNRLPLNLKVDSIYTLTTIDSGKKGDHGPIPKPGPLPLPYHDDFQAYEIYQEPNLLSPMTGSWEITKDPDGNKFARQVVQSPTVAWSFLKDSEHYPAAIIGDVNWQNITMSCRIRIPSINGTSSVILGVRVSPAGWYTYNATGLFLNLTPNLNGYAVSTNISALTVIDAGLLPSVNKLAFDKWYNVTLAVKGSNFSAYIDNHLITTIEVNDKSIAEKTGWVALATGSWGKADFDDLRISD